MPVIAPLVLLYPDPALLHPDGPATVSVADAVRLFSEAVMVVEPAATPAAKPAVLIVALAGFEDDQVAEEVTFCEVPSLSVSVAVICRVAPAATLPTGAERVIVPVAGGGSAATFSVTPAETLFSVAVMVAEPALRAVATPDAVTVATAALDVVQAAVEVTLAVVPSL